MMSCLLISHGKIAQALVEASQRIVGECKNVFTLDCEALSPAQLRGEIAHLIESQGSEDGLFILISLRGGSCWNAAAQVAHEYDKVEVLSGLNLPLLLSFVTKHRKHSFEELGAIMLEDGIRGITHL